jgi:hypothetical protein
MSIKEKLNQAFEGTKLAFSLTAIPGLNLSGSFVELTDEGILRYQVQGSPFVTEILLSDIKDLDII